MFRLNYRLDYDGYFELMKDFSLHGRSNRWQRVSMRVIVPAPFLLFGVLALLDNPDGVAVFTSVLLIGVGVLMSAVLFKPMINQQIRSKIWTQKKLVGAPYGEDVTLLFEEDALTYTGLKYDAAVMDEAVVMESKARYDEIKSADVCKTAVFLRIDAMRVYIAPFSGFANDAELERFLAFIGERCLFSFDSRNPL